MVNPICNDPTGGGCISRSVNVILTAPVLQDNSGMVTACLTTALQLGDDMSIARVQLVISNSLCQEKRKDIISEPVESSNHPPAPVESSNLTWMGQNLLQYYRILWNNM